MYAFYFWPVLLLMEIVMLFTGLIVLLFTFPFDPMRKVIDWHSTIWAKLHYWINPLWKVHYSGGEHVKKGKPYVIIANHQSMLDIVLMYWVPQIFKWVSKKEALWIPFAGQALLMHRDILIRRGEKSSMKQMIKKAQYFLAHNVCVSVFPEGTRTLDGQIHRFKDGAFALAKLTHTAILPVVMDGNFDVMPKKGNRIKARHNFYIKVLPEITVEEIENTSVQELAQKIQARMLSEHKKIAPEKYN
jgi:1-acyl-sn-glycerol-3-phosphate acyltransferase